MNDGALKALAVTSATRYAAAPNVPTVAEAGFPGAEVTWYAFIAAPKGTPAAVVQKLNGALNDMLADDKFRKRLEASGIEPEARTVPSVVRAQIQSEIDAWRAAAVKPASGG
jgi:tripartite-type tricarboxylate transporter receptor subunit TctC